MEIDSISADCAPSVAVAVIVSVYALVADRARRSAVAVAISVLVLAADPAGRIAKEEAPATTSRQGLLCVWEKF